MITFLPTRLGYLVASFSGSHFGGSAARAAGTVPSITAELLRTTATAKSNLDRTIALSPLVATLFFLPLSRQSLVAEVATRSLPARDLASCRPSSAAQRSRAGAETALARGLHRRPCLA